MPEPTKRLILANGEKYVDDFTKQNHGGPAEMPRTYGAARDLLRENIAISLTKIAALPPEKKFKDEAVLCLRLHPDMTAKTYDPQAIFGVVRDIENVGSRNYTVLPHMVAQTKRVKKLISEDYRELSARMVFVRSNLAGYRRLLQALDIPEKQLPREFREAIQRIEFFDTLDPFEQVMGFEPHWHEGRVEITLHPSRHSDQEQLNFLKHLFREHDVPWESTRVASYVEGPTFISCRITKAALNAIAGANPLRSAHPLVFGELENLRDAPSAPAPTPPTTTTKSTIKIGMFDGGIDPDHPLLKGHVEQDESLSIKTRPNADMLAHGTAVAGVLLYGPLNDHKVGSPLPSPSVSVTSIRTLPTSDPKDIDLYECIDVIEAAVPARPDITSYNISFGPRGAILEDSISRFTYALDRLASAHKVGFCVAVGNDGEAGIHVNRIQAPSDLVNGLGVGAFTKRDGIKIHASYSCHGPGRECGKMKPDLSAFGGCSNYPMHLVATIAGKKMLAWGTSFASPIVASLAGQTAQSFERGTPLLSRALLVHTAEHPDNSPDHLLGNGIVPSSLNEILRCENDSVTIVFQGSIEPTKRIHLPILLPPEVQLKGKVKISWTVAALPFVSPNHPSDYTSCCIEDTFYPNSRVYKFSKKENGKTLSKIRNLDNDVVEVAELRRAGWICPALPHTESGNKYPKSENERRKADLKWEPIVRKHVSKDAGAINTPFLILHAIPRNGAKELLDYAAVVTISAPKFEGDLYDLVIRRFSALQPIRLRTEAELRVQI